MSECKGQTANTAPPSGLADALRCVGLVQASEAEGRTACDGAIVEGIATAIGFIDRAEIALEQIADVNARQAEEIASLRAEVNRLSALVEKFKTTTMEIVPSSQEGFDRLDDEEECNDCGYVGARVDGSRGESGDFGALGQGDGPACPICVATANTPGACEAHAFERIYDTLGRLVMLAEGAS